MGWRHITTNGSSSGKIIHLNQRTKIAEKSVSKRNSPENIETWCVTSHRSSDRAVSSQLEDFILFPEGRKEGVDNTGKDERSLGIPRLAGAGGTQLCRNPIVLQNSSFKKKCEFLSLPLGGCSTSLTKGEHSAGAVSALEGLGGWGGMRGALGHGGFGRSWVWCLRRKSGAGGSGDRLGPAGAQGAHPQISAAGSGSPPRQKWL